MFSWFSSSKGTEEQFELYIYYDLDLDMSDIILSLFNEKLALATRLAIQYGPYRNDEEQYRFIHASYCCVSFTVISFDDSADGWEEQIFDCQDFQDVDPQNHEEWDPTTKGVDGADYLAIVKVVLSGNDEEDSGSRATELTDILANPNMTDVDVATFIDYTERCMQGDTDKEGADFDNCKGYYLGLDVESFES